MGDHLNSGIRNIVVRGPGLNCRRCSSVIGIPRKPKSTRKSRSCWVTDRPCTAYINKKFKNPVNFLQCVLEWITEFEKGWAKTGLEHKLQEILIFQGKCHPLVKELLQFQLIITEGLRLTFLSAIHQCFTVSFFTCITEKIKCSMYKVSRDKALFIGNNYSFVLITQYSLNI